jgi:hypothetical protein
VGEFIDGIATGILGPSLADKAAEAVVNALARFGDRQSECLGGRQPFLLRADEVIE